MTIYDEIRKATAPDEREMRALVAFTIGYMSEVDFDIRTVNDDEYSEMVSKVLKTYLRYTGQLERGTR